MAFVADQPWKRVAEFVRDARADLGRREGVKVTQAALAARAGTSESTIRVLETARRDSYSASTLRDVSEALGYPADAIASVLRGDEPPSWDPVEKRYGPEVTLAEKLADLDRRLTIVERLVRQDVDMPEKYRRLLAELPAEEADLLRDFWHRKHQPPTDEELAS